jgi:hypothetical protein
MARRHRVAVHLDGARIFNAAIALETDVATLAGYADSISFCLSKGLACPVGSLLCGSRDFIEQAHRARKLLGGGMRQAGIIAAAGVVALDAMIVWDWSRASMYRPRRAAPTWSSSNSTERRPRPKSSMPHSKSAMFSWAVADSTASVPSPITGSTEPQSIAPYPRPPKQPEKPSPAEGIQNR